MVAIPFALSVHHFISSVGAEVGFASLIGLALLVLLFFSQARETHTLRSRADEAGLRIEELEAELAELAEQVSALPAEISVRAASPRAAPGFAAVQPGVPAAAGAGREMTLPPAAPAGMGAPALAAATRLIPDPLHPLPEYQPATSAGNGNGVSARPVVAASAATMQRAVQSRPAGTARPVAAPPRVGVGGARPGQGPGAGRGRPPGTGQPRQGNAGRPAGPPLRPPERRSRGRLMMAGLAAALVVAVAAVVVGVIALTGGNGAPSSASQSSTTNALTSHRSSRVAAVQPSTVTVSVLNGTDLSGLAGKVADQLAADGYRKEAKPTNAADQTHTSTIVAYMAPAYRRDALAVASSLKLSSRAVQAVDATTKATVCPPAQACTSAVVVTVGQDLAQQ